ncbi:MAG: hypothetical protein ABI142_08595, partial [Bryocella sp.]
MKSENLPVALVLAICVGVAQFFLLAFCWSYIDVYSPRPNWLASIGITGFTWRALLYLLDTIVNVVLCLPAALILWS